MSGRRTQSVETIQREMAAFARRARALAARLHPQLTLVSYTFLSHLEENPGTRATDLAAQFLLDKSTVSRQVGVLRALGFVECRPDPADQRVQALYPTAEGSAALASVSLARRAAMHDRLAHWDTDDLERFARYLERYNRDSAGDAQAPAHRDGAGDTPAPAPAGRNEPVKQTPTAGRTAAGEQAPADRRAPKDQQASGPADTSAVSPHSPA
jgi:DNA-binding MarR family transcriptional regulator